MIPAWPILLALSATLVWLAAIVLRPYLGQVRSSWFLIASIIAVVYAGTKTGHYFSFELGLADAGSTYDAAEGLLVAKWTASAALDDYTFRWTYAADGAEHVELPPGKVSDGEARAVIPAGIRLLHVACWAEYVPPPTVVTNGVYHLSGVMRAMDGSEKIVTPAVPIVVDGKQLAPPADSPGDFVNATAEEGEKSE